MDALLFFSFRFLCLPFLPDLFTYTMLLEAWYLHSSVLPLLDRLWSACLVYSLAATYGGGWKDEWMDGMRSMHTPSIQRRRFNTCPSVLDLPGSDVGFLDSQDRTFCISYFFSFPGFLGALSFLSVRGHGCISGWDGNGWGELCAPDTVSSSRGGRAYELLSGTRWFGSDRKRMGMTMCLLYTIDMNQWRCFVYYSTRPLIPHAVDGSMILPLA